MGACKENSFNENATVNAIAVHMQLIFNEALFVSN